MRALITGGAGFIGSHLARELVSEHNEVYVVDNLSTGSIQNIKDLSRRRHFHFHMDTILNEKLMRTLMKKCDCVYHLAAAVGVKYIIDNPLESLSINVTGTEIVLELANELGKKKVILASTSEVYGKNSSRKVSFKETDDRLMGPTTISRWSYACSKALDEFLTLAYHREKKLPVVIIRFFNICGPRQTGRYGMVIPRFVKAALLNKPITVYGDGKQTRSFTHVMDAVSAIIKLSSCRTCVGEIFNLGNPNSISINRLAQKIKKMTASSSPIIHIPYEKAYEKGFEDMRHRKPDIGKLKRAVSFKPAYSIDDILRDVIGYFKD
ncbi:MAG: GDP-mannose 4,6-dehydratase [Candidatus Omnitrophica bacterium]|nr:GDP-mannose 4,6-dehydratase [Candidatus Omnitrophota bacterium]